MGGPGLALTTRMGIRKRETKALGRRRLRIERTPPLTRVDSFISRVAPDEESDDGCEERQGRDEGGGGGRVSVCVADAVRRLRLAISRSSASARVSRELRVREPEDEAQERCRGDGRGELASVRRTVGERDDAAPARGTESRRAERRKDSCTGREGKGVIFRFFQMGRHAPVMRRWRREKPRMTPPFLLDRSAALRSAVSPSFLILYRSLAPQPGDVRGHGLGRHLDALTAVHLRCGGEGASVLSLPSPSSPSGTGLGGGAGCAYETRSLTRRGPPCPWRRAR